MLRGLVVAIFSLVLSTGQVLAQGTPSPENAKVYFIWPGDGQVIRGGKLWVRFGLRNMGVAPSGVDLPNTGHHHLILNADPPPFDEPVPADKNHIHYGAGQTEVRLELPPGRHTLQLILGDDKHIPHDPPVMSRQITVIVP